jgi:hypothetical protein
MKYTKFILVGLIILGSALFIVSRDKSASNPLQGTEKGFFETRTSEQGQVTIKVTPETLSGGQGKFRIVFDTHSVDLNQDLVEIAVLTDGQGNTYTPTRWEGSGPGGHHREGILVFELINSSTSYLELTIKNVGGVSERLFKWSLK